MRSQSTPQPLRFLRNYGFVSALLAALCCAVAQGQQASPAPAPAPSQALVQPPAKEVFRVYLLMGQSNMAGRGELTPDSQTTDPRILAMLPEGRWVLAKNPLHEKIGRVEPGVGPGYSFATTMLGTDATIVIGLVPCAVGGTPLKRWEKGGDLYQRALERAKLAAQAGVLAGVLWHQGEADTDKQPWADSYEARLSRMFEDLRRDLGQPELPIVVGQLGEFLVSEKHPYVETVRAALRHMPARVPLVGYADSTGLKDKGDKLHFDTAAQKEMGARFARAMQELSKR